MPRRRTIATRTIRPTCISGRKAFSCTTQYAIKPVSDLPSWDVIAFRKLALDPALPARIPCSRSALPPASQKWFLHSENPDRGSKGRSTKSELNYPIWNQHQNIIIPIELTHTSPNGTKTFQRSEGPLKLFLDHSFPLQATLTGGGSRVAPLSSPSLYIAQCPLVDLPKSLREDLPTPELVLKAGRGDIYDSSLWMGRPPTFTPLHKDPNPNLFMQLAGQKVVRLFEPEVGTAIFDAVRMKLGGRGNASFRGEEMMQGKEREELEEVVWGNEESKLGAWREMGFEAMLSMGDALFIPKGWWHSVRGVGVGMNASVNWWFR